jgi:hypothetical protein
MCNDIVINGDTSDGYHTFNELYHHRAVLFSVIVRLFHARSWKSKQHDDGSMHAGMFIVGIETPDGQATYHYDIEPYWDMFECRELDKAPKWDKHTPQQAIERIGKLRFDNLELVWPSQTSFDDLTEEKQANIAAQAAAFGAFPVAEEDEDGRIKSND